jgi:DNA-binding MurR/RpiR family transcriptional regulator
MTKRATMQLAKSAGQDLLALLKSQSMRMTASELRVTEVVLSNAEQAATSSITALAARAEVSEASVVRFCRSLGFRGYPEFRLALAADLGRRAASDDEDQFDGGITSEDTLEEIILKIGRSDSKAIESTVTRIDPAAVDQLIVAVATAGTIGVIGVGASAFVALDLQLKLNRLGRPCIAWTDAHIGLTSVASLGERDLLIAISHSGATHDVIDVLKAFSRRGVTTALITNNGKSAGAALADHVLLTSASETALRSGATASRIAQLTIVDCVCVGLAHRDMARTKTALGDSRAAIRSRHGVPTVDPA